MDSDMMAEVAAKAAAFEDPTVAVSPDQLVVSPAVPPGQEMDNATGELHVQSADRLSGQVADSENDAPDDEGFIQQYMERLLKRVGRAPDEETQSPANVPAGKPSDSDAQEAEPAVESRQEDRQAQPTPSAKQPEPLRRPAEQPRQNSVSPASTFVKKDRTAESRQVAPEMAADLLAMRELANKSARAAINRSDRRRYFVRGLSEMLVASICLASSILLMMISSGILSAPAIGGMVGFSFGLVGILRGVRTLSAVKTKKRREPAEK
jgi:hypothetical protein